MMAITSNFPTEISFWEALIYPSKKNMHEKLANRSSLLYYSFRYLYTRAEDTLWKMRRFKDNYYSWLLPEIVMILLVPIEPIKHIEKKKKEYEAAKILLYNLIKNMDFSRTYYYEYKYIILEALRQDVYEVVRPILRNLDTNIDYTNEGHNVIQFAVLNRSEKVYKYIICPILKRKESYRVKRDSSYNNLLHLAGKLAPSYVLSRTTGAALQLQRELQFREEVENIMEPAQLTEVNADNETPEMVFTREHANLVKEGEQWMKTTAESCSITAALIVTIVFAAAITVPGGNNQDTGLPLFKNEVAFNIFAVCDATSLFTAATALLVFLSILTARFSEKDFLVSLPRRLIIGLCLLSLSTTAMMVAFSAVLFLVFCDQRPWMLAQSWLTFSPILDIVYSATPLHQVDLYQSTVLPC
ncbi:ankyrin repeat-containing protein [Tanacetum coccineum]